MRNMYLQVVFVALVFTFSSASATWLGDDEAIGSTNFGIHKVVTARSISGMKWLDANGNAARDADEPGLPGVTIYLDRNNNGRLDRGESRTVTMRDDPATTADEAGLFWFTDLKPGNYSVREVVPDGFVQTFPSADSHEVFLLIGEVVEGIDFGNQPERLASIRGLKWLDANGNTTRDADEPGLPGVTIYLDRNNNGRPDRGEPRTVTMRDDPATAANEAGLFWFTGLEPGTYTVREVVPKGFVQTFPSAAFHEVFLRGGEIVDGIDFGNQPERLASIHGLKWLDANGNAARDADEPGLPGVTIYLDRNNNGRLDRGEPRTVTMRDDPATAANETGEFWFTGLHPGIHAVREVVPDGFVQTFPSVAFHEVFLHIGEIVRGIDFGNQPEQFASIHGLKWLDANGNAARDADEPGLPGVTIYLDLNRNGNLDSGEPLTVTMADDPATAANEAGRFWFSGLETGIYSVREVVPDGFVQTFPSAAFHEVSLLTGEIVEGIDFGNQPEQSASIHGLKWLDANGNATRDADEPGLPGVTIYLDLNNNGNPDSGEPSTVTMRDDPATAANEAGLFWFTSLEPGTYTVREVVPDGFVQTFPSAGQHIVVLSPGTILDGLDFGNRRREQ